MSLELRSVQVRLDGDAYAALKLIANVEDKDYGEVARELLTMILLGRVHALKVMQARLSRAVTSDSLRESDPE